MTMQDLTGQVLGSYQLRELIGVGGMGAVYRGYQTTLERAIAVKVLSTMLANEPGYIERFYREAKTAAALEHAHIVPVHDFGIQGNLSYVVMRLLTGGTLADRMQDRIDKNKPLPSLGEIASLLRQIGSALDYAHTQNVIHRDIKPSNIMFDNQGNSYLVDFGIAKLLEATSALTSTGTTMGTPAYMPPEQWRSEDLTPAADQYALGATIYSLVVGRVPYEATTPYGLMHKHLNEKPDPPHLKRAGVPESISLVLERALAKVPEQRFPTVTAFALAFESATSGQIGDRTGFFTTTLPTKMARISPPMTPSAVSAPPTNVEPAAIPRTPVLTPPGGASQPAITVASPSRPIHRHPLVWVLALGLVAALVAMGIMVMSGQDEKSTTTPPATGPIAVVNTEVPTAPSTGEGETTVEPTHEPGLVILPSNTPADTETPVPTETPTETPVPTDTLTPTPVPTDTPTATPEPTDTPTATPIPTDTPQPTPLPTEPPPSTPTPPEVAELPTGQAVVIVSGMGAYLRDAPSPDAPFTPISNERLPLVGRTEDGRWYQVDYQGRLGWVRRSAFVQVEGDPSSVPVVSVEPSAQRPVVVIGGMGAYLRESPSPDAPYKPISNARLPLVGRSEDGAWYQVDFRGRLGWVRRSAFVRVEGDLDSVPVVGTEAAPPAAEHPMLVISGMGAYLREAPSPDAPFVPISNVTLPIIGRTNDGTWYRVDYQGRPGWVRRSAFVTVEGDLESVPIVNAEGAPKGATLVISGMGAYLRDAPSPDAPAAPNPVSNVNVPIIGRSEDGAWYQVEYQGRLGWIHKSAFDRVEGDLESVPVVPTEAGPSAAEHPLLMISGMGAYLREAPSFDAKFISISNVRLPIIGRTEDGTWYQVDYQGRPGWIRQSAFVRVEGDVEGVPVVR